MFQLKNLVPCSLIAVMVLAMGTAFASERSNAVCIDALSAVCL